MHLYLGFETQMFQTVWLQDAFFAFHNMVIMNIHLSRTLYQNQASACT
jgi:hypothetical protein